MNDFDATGSNGDGTDAMTDRHDCPSTATLVDAAASRGDRVTRARVADHLIACPRCAEEFRLLQALAPWADEHAHLIAQPGPGGAARQAARTMPRWAFAVAATLALAVAGLGLELLRLEQANRTLAAHADQTAAAPQVAALATEIAGQQRQIDELTLRLQAAEAPDVNPAIVDLEAAGAPRSANAAGAASIAANARRIVFVLNTSRHAPASMYDVEIVDASGGVLWKGSGLRQSADGTLTLSASRALVSSAARIRLYATAHGRALVEEYVVPPVR